MVHDSGGDGVTTARLASFFTVVCLINYDNVSLRSIELASRYIIVSNMVGLARVADVGCGNRFCIL